MHPRAAEEILKACRSTTGICSVANPPKTEALEDCILELGRQRDNATQLALTTLANAFFKFAPDLAAELSRRWKEARSQEDAALADLMALLK